MKKKIIKGRKEKRKKDTKKKRKKERKKTRPIPISRMQDIDSLRWLKLTLKDSREDMFATDLFQNK